MTGDAATSVPSGLPTGIARVRPWVFLAIAIVLLNVGNLILDVTFKQQAVSFEMFFAPGLIVAIPCLGASFFSYVKALASLPLAVAYPVMVGVSLLIVAVVGWLWLGIDLEARHVIGIVSVFAGVTLISRRAHTAAEGVIE